MANYTKLFNSIITSTIWTEDDKTRIVWITMLAMCDQHGEVQASIPGIARLAGVSLEDAEMAIDKLLSPDKHSRTPDNEGRRIAPIDGGWELLNHAKYRRMASLADTKEATAKRVKRHRARNGNVTQCNGNVTLVSTNVTPVSANVTLLSDKAEAEAEAEADIKKNKKPSYYDTFEFCQKIGLAKIDAEYMQDKWLETGFKNNGKPIKDWQAQIRNWKRMSYLPSTKQKPAMRSIHEPQKLRGLND